MFAVSILSICSSQVNWAKSAFVSWEWLHSGSAIDAISMQKIQSLLTSASQDRFSGEGKFVNLDRNIWITLIKCAEVREKRIWRGADDILWQIKEGKWNGNLASCYCTLCRVCHVYVIYAVLGCGISCCWELLYNS